MTATIQVNLVAGKILYSGFRPWGLLPQGRRGRGGGKDTCCASSKHPPDLGYRHRQHMAVNSRRADLYQHDESTASLSTTPNAMGKKRKPPPT